MISEARQAAGAKLIRVMMITMILSSMSALMFNIVLPEISKEFQLGMAEVSWMSSSYSLIYAIGTVIYGKMADRFKLKNLIAFGLVLFAAGSLIGLVSQSFEVALLARCLQSAGAASIPAVSMLIPIRYFEPSRRGAALGMAAAGLAVGSALGPVISAVMVSFAHWRWLFVVPVAIIFTLPFYRRYLQDEETVKTSFDWAGGLLLAAAAGLALMGFTNGSLPLVLCGLAFAALFVWRIRRASEPFVRPEMFRNRKFTTAVIIAVLVNGIGVSIYFLTPVLLSRVQQLEPYWIGFAMVPAAAVAAVFARRAGRLADKRGNMVLYAAASGLLTLCFLLLSTFAHAPAWMISAILIFGNLGQSCMMIVLSNTVSGTLSREQAGVGMGMFSMFNFMSHGIASGLYGIAADWQAASSWNPLHGGAGSESFSNIYLALAALHIAVLILYRAAFRTSAIEKKHSGTRSVIVKE